MATASKKKKINLDKCWNTEDPITLEDLTDKSLDETIMIPSSHEKKKNHCFLVESLFGWYSKQSGPITNPLDPSRVLTDDEINELLIKMSKINPKVFTNTHFKFKFVHPKETVPDPRQGYPWRFYHLYIKYKSNEYLTRVIHVIEYIFIIFI
jgi:hypothetical protein